MISYAKKKWGQNFLVDKNLLKKIVTTFNPKKEDRVLEIGPGEGALTELILPLVHKMAAVEIDPLLVQRLQSLEHLKNLCVVQSAGFFHNALNPRQVW